jgi:hypothetical protein
VYVGFSWSWYYGYGSVGYSSGWGYPYYRHPSYWYGNWSFWWPEPVCVAYVPYGFYVDTTPVFVREVTVIREVPVAIETEGALVETTEYQGEPGTEVQPAPAPEDGTEPVEEEGPPVLDSTTEKYLREGSGHFANADYKAAADSFRLAVASDPKAPPPRFAFGQAFLALGDYENASRILRGAIQMEPAILRAPGSIVGVYKSADEFNRVLNALKFASLEHRTDPDLLFLVGYQQYFSGDPQAMVTFQRLAESFPEDPMVAVFNPALAERFPELATLPVPK